ncbi:M17 family peptidase N-terminal domain-containing protein [Caldalkalibacillus mannanilyticus]|uniref:M17 family peptidase N-terminal domain-containing protein n=1 Tax=Caldalkalibacillus mannanilyticus TaxID=1418 RepID=UPI000A3E4DAE
MSIHVHIVKETELAKVESDLIVIALFEHSSLSASYFDQLNAACDNQLAYILKDEQHLSKFKSTTFVHTLGQIKAKQILFVGAGEQEKYSHEKVRELAGRVTREALKNHKSSIVFCVESFITDKVGMEKAVHALTEGSLLATHRVQHYKSSSREGAQLDQLAFYSSEEIEGLDVHIETAKASQKERC